MFYKIKSMFLMFKMRKQIKQVVKMVEERCKADGKEL